MDEPANKLLAALYARTRYAALAELASHCGLGPQAAAGALAALRQRGHEIEQTPAHGLRLVRPVKLDAHLIEHELGTGRVGRHAIVFPEVGSTNDVAFDSARQPLADGLVVLAESQRGGRGRLGRRWISPPGANVLMSVLLLDGAGSLSSEALTLGAGVAAAAAIERVAGVTTQLKWPNDVLLDGAKVCGILVEVRQRPRRAIVIGIGMNVNAAPPASEVTRPATCLADHVSEPLERIELVRAVLRNLQEWVDATATDSPAAELTRTMHRLHREWVSRCGMFNQRLTVLSGGKRFTGRVLDIHPLEGLMLQTDEGQQLMLPAATSSVE